MKYLAFSIGILLTLGACNEEVNLNPDSASTETLIVALNSENGLRIIEFIEDGRDKTSLFNGYLFIFRQNGTVTATEAGQSINGTYSVYQDDGRLELEMVFPTNTALYELRDDWYFVSQNQNTIRFDDNGDVIEFQIQ